MLDTTLIEKALGLTGKTILSVSDIDLEECEYDGRPMSYFNWEKFCYYLLNLEFIARYSEEVETSYLTNDVDYHLICDFGLAIYKYQSGDEEPLIELLSKI